MTRSILTNIALYLGVLAGIAIVPARAADPKAKEGRITGTVHMMEKDKSTIVVRKGNVERQVIYNGNTKWLYGTQASSKPSSFDQLKQDWYINCQGTFEGMKLVASACRFRESK